MSAAPGITQQRVSGWLCIPVIVFGWIVGVCHPFAPSLYPAQRSNCGHDGRDWRRDLADAVHGDPAMLMLSNPALLPISTIAAFTGFLSATLLEAGNARSAMYQASQKRKDMYVSSETEAGA